MNNGLLQAKYFETKINKLHFAALKMVQKFYRHNGDATLTL